MATIDQSLPVTLASDQPPIDVDVSDLPLPDGAATEATLAAVAVSASLTAASVSAGATTVGATVTSADAATLTRSVIVGRTEGGGVYLNISADEEGHLEVSVTGPNTAFGEVSVAESTPDVQVDFVYSINPEMVTSTVGGTGSVTQANAMAVLATGASASGFARLESRRYMKYRAGQGGLSRFTAMFTTGAANSQQLAGLGTVSNGLFFGYNGTAFGVMRRYGGAREIQTLTVATASNTTENITITLGGVTKSVAVTNSNAIVTTCKEIAAADYSTTGVGWDAYQVGSTVAFVARATGNVAGAFTLSAATTAVGTFAETLAGAAPTDTWVPQASWNVDTCDGGNDASNPSGINLDPTKLNPYGVRFQYLGAGGIEFLVENPVNGQFVAVHKIAYANANTIPSMLNPSFPIFFEVSNTSNATNITNSTASAAAFVEGQELLLGPIRGASSSKANVGTSLTNIVSLRNSAVFAAKGNRAHIHVRVLSMACDGAKPAVFQLVRNATLGGTPNWTSVNATTSVAQTDTAGTTVTGGTQVATFALGKTDSLTFELDALEVYLNPGETFTLAGAASSTTTDATASMTWIEDL